MKLSNPLNWTVRVSTILITLALVTAAAELYYLHELTGFLLETLHKLAKWAEYSTRGGTWL